MFKIILVVGATLLRLSNPDGIYASGDTVRIYASSGQGETLVHEQVYEGPRNVVFKYDDTSIGFAVAPELFRPALPCPKDFGRYWRAQLKAMRAVKPTALLEKAACGDDGIECCRVEIDCPGVNPVRGFIAMPAGAQAGTLPIVVFAHAAGVAGGWCRANAAETARMARWGNGAIVININAFGMLNDQPQKYYDELENGELKDYSRRAWPDRDSCVFRGMFLRLVRALDFACGLEEWDGTRVMAYGQSQGGYQALALAGLDARVNCIVGIVPGGCDQAGPLLPGQVKSWPWNYGAFGDKALADSIIPYFDAVNFIARTKAEMWIEIGLQDKTCTPDAIWSGLNANRKSVKHIVPSPYRYHDEPSARYWQQWHDTVYNGRMSFVNDWLK